MIASHMLSCFSRVQLCATTWTAARQAPLSMGFSRQEYQRGVAIPSSRDLPDPGIEPMFLTSNLRWQAGSLSLVPSGKPKTSEFGNTGILFIM